MTMISIFQTASRDAYPALSRASRRSSGRRKCGDRGAIPRRGACGISLGQSRGGTLARTSRMRNPSSNGRDPGPAAGHLEWLIAQGLADATGRREAYRPRMIEIFRRRELLRVAGQLSEELGLLRRATLRGANWGDIAPVGAEEERPFRAGREFARVHTGTMAARARPADRLERVGDHAPGRNWLDDLARP